MESIHEQVNVMRNLHNKSSNIIKLSFINTLIDKAVDGIVRHLLAG